MEKENINDNLNSNILPNEVNNEDDKMLLPSIYGAIVSQKSQADFISTFSIKKNELSKIQYILSTMNNIILTVFFPYKPMLNSIIFMKMYWIILTVLLSYTLYSITIKLPIQNKLYVSNVIKIWIIMFAVLIYFITIRNKSSPV
jgi:hypothetical protein